MKRIILLLTAVVFLMSVPFASARDANRDEIVRLTKESTAAQKAAALKEKEAAQAAVAKETKETKKPAKKAKEKAKTEKK